MSDLEKLLSAAVLSLLGKVLWDWLKSRKNGHANGASGEKSIEFWRLQIRQIIEDVMDRRDARIREIVREELDRRQWRK